MKKLIFLIFSSLLPLMGNKLFHISKKELNKIENKYGKKAIKRIILWDDMLQSIQNDTETNKLKVVNDFFNKIKYVPDKRVWKTKDYWASPFEFLGVGAGDCEDYAIAKYFALRVVGISDKKLKITYVKLKHNGTAHMVLNYYNKPSSKPIVLDNMSKMAKFDIVTSKFNPIYSFNSSGVWLVENKTKNLILQGNNKLKKWKSIISKISQFS